MELVRCRLMLKVLVMRRLGRLRLCSSLLILWILGCGLLRCGWRLNVLRVLGDLTWLMVLLDCVGLDILFVGIRRRKLLTRTVVAAGVGRGWFRRYYRLAGGRL